MSDWISSRREKEKIINPFLILYSFDSFCSCLIVSHFPPPINEFIPSPLTIIPLILLSIQYNEENHDEHDKKDSYPPRHQLIIIFIKCKSVSNQMIMNIVFTVALYFHESSHQIRMFYLGQVHVSCPSTILISINIIVLMIV